MAAGDTAAYVTMNVGVNPDEPGLAAAYATHNTGVDPTGTGEAAAYATHNTGVDPTGTGEAVAYVTANVAAKVPVKTGEAAAYVTLNSQVPAGVVPASGVLPVITLAHWPENDEVTTVTPVSEGERSDSAVLLADGRVLYVFVDGSTIKQGYAESADAFMTLDGSVSNITTLWSANEPNCCVFKTSDGKVFLITSGNPSSAVSELKGSRCWYSPSGLGGDWINRGTIQFNGDMSQSNWIHMGTLAKSVGQPYIDSSGTWTVTCPVYIQGDDVTYKKSAIYRSSDEGYTWVQVLNVGHYIVGGPYGSGASRNFSGLGGRLFWMSTANTDDSKGYYSDNNGASWVYGTVLPVQTFYTHGIQDGTYVYLFNGSGTVTRSLNPINGYSNFEAWRQYPMSSRNGIIIQPLGSNFVYMHDGKVLALSPPRGGWMVGQIGIGSGRGF